MLGNWTTVILRFVSLLAAVACIGLASMLHEDEERRLQERVKRFQKRVEAWWIKVDESKTFTLAWAASIIRGVARLTGACFDRVFTPRLISMRIVGISFFLSIASFFLTALMAVTFGHHVPASVSKMAPVADLMLFGFLALVPAISESQSMPLKPWLPRGMRIAWWLALITTLLSIASFLLSTLLHPQSGTNLFPSYLAFLVVIFVIGEMCDIIVIVLTRWTLRRVSVAQNIGGILASVSVLFLLLLVILALPIVIGLTIMGHAQYVGLAFLFSIVLNSLDVVVVLAAFVVGVVWLTLHLVWPVLQRPLYAFQRIEIADKAGWHKWKNWLLVVGLFLLGAAIPGLPSWVKTLLPK